MEVIPYFGSNASVLLNLAIGIDRMYCIAAPFKYNKAQKHLYMFILLLLPFLYPSTWIVLSFIAMAQDPHRLVVCGVTTLVASNLSQYNFIATVVFSVFIVIVYCTTWTIAKISNSQAAGQLLKPLTIIMIIVTLTYPVSYILLAIFNIVVPADRLLTYRMSTGVLTSFGYASHFYVYYYFR
uniref:G-protein coupled receptors family 1 profile domain-containing protein n=1 Tax=Acrobeloides nanus TaxID=290746 RepID=A0A914DFW5_9BILA